MTDTDILLTDIHRLQGERLRMRTLEIEAELRSRAASELVDAHRPAEPSGGTKVELPIERIAIDLRRRTDSEIEAMRLRRSRVRLDREIRVAAVRLALRRRPDTGRRGASHE